MIKVVAALIEKNGKFLIARRSTGSIDVLGKWEFPGGKVEKEESEEFEMDVKCIRFLVNNVCEYPSKTIDLRLYKCKHISGEFNLHDHSEYRFVAKNEIINYDLCPADIPLAVFVKENM